MGLNVKHFTDAFKKTGVRPIRGTFCNISGDKRKSCSCCALTALFLASNNLTEKELVKLYKAGIFCPETMEVLVEDWANTKYGKRFVSIFIMGFDNTPGEYIDTESPSYRLGQKVRKAVFSKKKELT